MSAYAFIYWMNADMFGQIFLENGELAWIVLFLQLSSTKQHDNAELA